MTDSHHLGACAVLPLKEAHATLIGFALVYSELIRPHKLATTGKMLQIKRVSTKVAATICPASYISRKTRCV